MDWLPEFIAAELESYAGQPAELVPVHLQGYIRLVNRSVDWYKLNPEDFVTQSDEFDARRFAAELTKRIRKVGFPFTSNAIIGKVDLVDCVRDSDSPFAEPDCFHYVLENAEIFDKPILGVKGWLGIWNYEPEDE